MSCLLLPASFVLPLGISSSYARASSRSSSAGTSRSGQSRVDRTGRGVGRKQQTRATAGGDHGAPTSDEASRVDWRPLHENFGQRASIFALDGTQPIDLLWAAIAQIGAVNSRLIRQKLCFEVRARIPLKKPLSDAFSGAVPGTHPAPCKRPQNRPRRGVAKLLNPAPRPNRPAGKKMHACPGRGGREASNEPL